MNRSQSLLNPAKSDNNCQIKPVDGSLEAVLSFFDSTNNQPLLVNKGLSRQKCGERLIDLGCNYCGEHAYRVHYCGKRTCPRCSLEYSRVVFAQTQEIANKIKIPYGMGWKLITLTLKKTSFDNDVKIAMRGLGKIWHNLLETAPRSESKSRKKVRRLRKEPRPRIVMGIGAIAQLEIGKSGNVHWHLLYLGRYIRQKRLSVEWNRLTGSPVVYIQKAILRYGILEIIGYIKKFGKQSAKMREAFSFAIKNRRVFRTYGCFYERINFEGTHECPVCGNVSWEFLGIVEMTPELLSLIRTSDSIRSKAG